MKASCKRAGHRLLAGLALTWAGIAVPAQGAGQATVIAPGQRADPSAKLPPLSPAVIDNTLSIGGADIAARKVDSRMTVAVTVEGHGPFRFVVDSGADTSALGLNAARGLRLPAVTPVMLHGMTASSVVGRVAVAELGVGQSTISNLELPVLKDEDLGAQGLLGIDALVEQRLMMDFEKHIITVEDARRPAPSMDGDIVVIARRRHGQLILTQASIEGHSVDAVIDTGSEITIGNSALRKRIFGKRSKKLETGEVIGVTGASLTVQLAHLDELRIGPILMRNVVIAFADVPPFAAFGLEDRPTIFLGTDLMESFRRISLDFHARKVRFQLKRCQSTGFFLSTLASMSRLSSTDPAANACRN